MAERDKKVRFEETTKCRHIICSDFTFSGGVFQRVIEGTQDDLDPILV